MARVLAIDIDVSQLDRLVGSLERLDADTLAEVGTTSVNEVAARSFVLSKTNMIAGLTLSDAYISRKMRLTLAKPSTRPRAVISSNGLLTSLGHYGARVQTQPVKRRNRSKGDPAVGIPPGQKRNGVTVEVRRGNRKLLAQAFTLAGLKDNEGNPLVFVRAGGVNPKTGKPKVERLLGPSVYQLFKYQIEQIGGDVADDLAETTINRAEEALQKALR